MPIMDRDPLIAFGTIKEEPVITKIPEGWTAAGYRLQVNDVMHIYLRRGDEYALWALQWTTEEHVALEPVVLVERDYIPAMQNPHALRRRIDEFFASGAFRLTCCRTDKPANCGGAQRYRRFWDDHKLAVYALYAALVLVLVQCVTR